MNIFVCDSCVEQAETCENKLIQLARKADIPLKSKVFSSGDALLFEAEPLLHQIDLIYLAVEISDTNGLQIADKLREMGYLGDIVFYTMDTTRAIEGYDVSALHYLLKDSTSDAKFAEVFHRALQRKEHREQEMLVLTCAGDSRYIPLRDIYYFEVNLRIITVYYRQDCFEFYSTMAQMEEQLYAKGFVRTHKSFLVNIRWIRSVNTNQIVLDTGEVLPVGKKYYTDNLKDITGIAETL